MLLEPLGAISVDLEPALSRGLARPPLTPRTQGSSVICGTERHRVLASLCSHSAPAQGGNISAAGASAGLCRGGKDASSRFPTRCAGSEPASRHHHPRATCRQQTFHQPESTSPTPKPHLLVLLSGPAHTSPWPFLFFNNTHTHTTATMHVYDHCPLLAGPSSGLWASL